MITSKSVVILGGSKEVFSDYASACKLWDFDAVIAINDIGAEMPEIDFWCTMHPEKMPKWLEQRRFNGFEDPKSFWTSHDRKTPEGLDVEFQTVKNTRGGSGLLAVYVARHLGYNKIVLCGIPMTAEGQHYHTSGAWKECKLYRIVWEKNPTLKDDVRSFSGWTQEKFGMPTETWLRGL